MPQMPVGVEQSATHIATCIHIHMYVRMYIHIDIYRCNRQHVVVAIIDFRVLFAAYDCRNCIKNVDKLSCLLYLIAQLI